ncbi:MAG: hypothetical protein V7784_12950 [Oceanospirillaceae bacterium]
MITLLINTCEMKMRKKFSYDFDDESEKSRISFEYAEDIEEKLAIKIESGVPVIYGNKQAFLLLAKTFSKLALGAYEDGFHVHLNTDFDAEDTEALRIILDNDA